MLSVLQKLPSSSQLHLGKPFSAVTEIRSEEINSPGANAFNIASKMTATLSFNPFIDTPFQLFRNTLLYLKHSSPELQPYNPKLQFSLPVIERQLSTVEKQLKPTKI